MTNVKKYGNGISILLTKYINNNRLNPIMEIRREFNTEKEIDTYLDSIFNYAVKLYDELYEEK